ITLFATIGFIMLWLNGNRRGCAYLICGAIGAGLATSLMKHLISRDRPTIVPRLIEVSGFSYPSGHSLGATSFYLLVMFIIWQFYPSRKARSIIATMIVLLIGGICFSRI